MRYHMICLYLRRLHRRPDLILGSPFQRRARRCHRWFFAFLRGPRPLWEFWSRRIRAQCSLVRGFQTTFWFFGSWSCHHKIVAKHQRLIKHHINILLYCWYIKVFLPFNFMPMFSRAILTFSLSFLRIKPLLMWTAMTRSAPIAS